MHGTTTRQPFVLAAFSACLSVTAVLLAVALPTTDASSNALVVALLAISFAAGQSFAIHVQIRRESVGFTLTTIPVVVGLAYCAPVAYVAASVVGSAVVLVIQRQQSVQKICFNLSLFGCESALAQTIFQWLRDGSDADMARGASAAAVAVVVAGVASSLALAIVMMISTGQFDARSNIGATLTGFFIDAATVSVGLLAVLLLDRAPAGLAVLAVLLGVLLSGSRSYTRLSWRHRRLTSLYGFTSAVGGINSTFDLAVEIMRQARDTLHCDVAEIHLPATVSRPSLSLRIDQTGKLEGLSAPGPLAELSSQGGPALVPRGAPRMSEDSSTASDAISVPLIAGGSTIGTLAVSDRWRYLPTFGAEDLQLFAALCDHAAVSLHGTLLLDQVRQNAAEREYQALHDTVTQLPNRRALLETASELTSGEDSAYAILAIDLIGFSDVNDTLGHSTGDLLLHEVGRRLLWNARPGYVARLGNDEFAVLLPLTGSVRDARLAATTALRSLQEPFELHGLMLETRVNAGLAVAPFHGSTPATILQRADAALAVAKRDEKSLHVYDLADDASSARRLQLVSDLRIAVAADTLDVYYQPKLDPRTGAVVGAEALARWQHPSEGFVPPDEFIPLAEHAGLVRALTASVLRTALAQCAEWRRAGHNIPIAVNLSPRILIDEQLPEEVAHALAHAGVPAHALTLEITETAVMSDVIVARRVLESLRAMGISLSLDDYGTGHSSLSYLATLPVNEMKLDKSFTLGLPADLSSLAIVRSTIDLGHQLGLVVVAEGVEEESARELLAEWSCDVVQGFFYTKPLPADAFDMWLRKHESSHLLPRAR